MAPHVEVKTIMAFGAGQTADFGPALYRPLRGM
jgi:hypothetical protein